VGAILGIAQGDNFGVTPLYKNFALGEEFPHYQYMPHHEMI
jgi:hypothetical protein